MQPLAATTPRGKAGSPPEHAAGFAKHLDGDHQPPAQAARAALADRPALAGKPFGKIVSLFARGLDLPPAEIASPEEPETPAPTAEEPPADTAPGEETTFGTESAEEPAPTTEG
jgi:hypothetical protein